MSLDTPQVLKALSDMHDPTKWAFFDELRIGTGFGKDSEQRFDAWAINYYPSKRNVTRCYEIKISKSDFLNEIRKPYKRRPGLRLSNEFYFVTPKDLLKIEDIPPECGLMEVDEKGNIETTLKAPFRDVMPPTWLFMSSICRRYDKMRFDDYVIENNKKNRMKQQKDVLIETLHYHISLWRNYSEGNKEVPDKIAKAIEDLTFEVKETLRQYKIL